MANPNDNIYRLYQNGLKHFSLPDFETFKSDMKDEQKRRRFYTNMQEAYSLPDFDTFSTDIGAVAVNPIQSAAPQPQQPTARPQTTAVKSATDTTGDSARVQSTTQSAQQTAWQPSWQQRAALDMQLRQDQQRIKKQMADGQQRIEGIKKGNRPGALMGEREFNPQSSQMETNYYTTQGERVSTPMEKSRRDAEYNTWWENNTEAGKRSKEQRLQREFEGRLSSLWSRHDPTEGDNAAEQAWSAAETRQKSAAETIADRNYSNYTSNYPMGGPGSHIVAASNNSRETGAARMSNFDLDRLMEDSWNNLGENGQQALIDDCHQMLRNRNPSADDLILYQQAKELARQQSNLRLYNLAVEKNRPKSELEYLGRKIADMNILLNLTKAAAVSKAGTTGDMAAYEAANEQYRQDGHKILDVAGMVAGFTLDPTTWLSAGVGGAATKGAMWAGGRYIAGRGATAAATNAAARQFATSMTGRVVGGVVGGAANFGTFEGIKEAENQFVHGGHIVGQDESGRYINEGYSASAVGGQVLHGLGMGAAIGWLTPVSGNVADKLVRGTSSTVGKVAGRAGVYAGATTLEGTIFSVPEWISGERDAMDVWTDNMAMMVGFKASHMIKTAGGVLGDLQKSFESPANGRKNRLDFESRLRQRMDAPSDGGLALTKDESAELERLGYGDLRELVGSAERTGNAAEGSLIAENAPQMVSRLTDMVQDTRVSEAARAKMYYYATGRKLPESTIMRGEMYEDGNGGFVVESQGANGVITSRTFTSRKAADIELERINRQTELNHIEIGERYQQTADFENRLQEACREVAEENDWDPVTVYRTCEEARRNYTKGVDKELDKAQHAILRKVTEAMGDFTETGVTDEMRGRINEKYGVDIDNAIRKEGNRRTEAEQTAIDEYLKKLIPDKAKEPNKIVDVDAEDITNQKRLTDQGEPRDNSGPHEPNGEKQPIGRAVMKFQDRQVEVLSGRVTLTDDGTMIDNERSDNSIVIRDLETGKVEMVSPEAILSYEEYAPETVMPDTEQPIYQQPGVVEQTEQSKYTSGQIKIRNSDGSETRGVLTGYVDEEGKHEYYLEGDLQHLHYATEGELDNILSDYQPDAPGVPEQSAEGNNGAENIAVAPEEFENGYTLGMKDVENFSDEQLDAQIAKLTTDAERLTDFGKGMLAAYQRERQLRHPQAEPQSAEQPIESGTPADGVAPTPQPEGAPEEPQKIPAGEQPADVPITPETVPNPTENPVSDAEIVPEAVSTVENVQHTPLQNLPRDEKGNPIFEQAESPEAAWDALVEFSEGDAGAAKEIADVMVEEKRKAFEKAQKLKSKGKTPTEILASRKANAAELTNAQAEFEYWQKMAAVEQNRQAAIRSQQEAEARRIAAERAEAEKAERAAQEEAARIEREALEGIPEWHMDTPENARARGSRRFSGQLFMRQEPVHGVSGKEVEVKFSQDDLPKGRVAVIEASQLQPSHIQGHRNPMFFIEEAQPKNRAEAVSTFAAKQIAEGIRPEEITGSTTAYTGAPTINARGEVIQGNNRSDALRYLWENHLPEQQAAYKQYLIDNAEPLGLDPEAVSAIQQPVLVNMLDVDDAEAVRLGQMTAQDTESGGIERIKPKNVAQKLGDSMRQFANMLLHSGDEDASFGQLVDRNGAEVLKWMSQLGAITNTQYQSAFDSKGSLTAEAKNDLQKVLYQAVFKGGTQQLEEMFDRLPAKAQRAILTTAFRDMDSPFAGKMLPEIQASIVAYNALMTDPTFAEAKKLEGVLRAVEAFKATTALDDRLEQYSPSDNFSNFALHLAAMYKAGDYSQGRITALFNEMYDLAQGKKEATLFEDSDATEYPLADVIKKVLNIDYKPAKNGNYNVANGGADVALRNQGGQGGEFRGNEPPASGEQTEAGTEPSGRGAGVADDSRGGGTPQQDRADKKEKVRPLTTDEAIECVADMEHNAPVAQQMPLTVENWDKQFPDGKVATPIGDVKMGEHQFLKLMREGRNSKLGMIRPTLEHPHIIVEVDSEAKEGDTAERPTSYIFIKSFKKADGSRYYYFTSISVSKDGMEVVVSNQEKSRNRILRLLTEGSVIWRAPKDAATASVEQQGLEYVQPSTTETATNGSGITPQSTSISSTKPVSASSSDIETEPESMRNGTATPQSELYSDGKDTQSLTDEQISGEESSVQPSDDKGTGLEQPSVQAIVQAASAEVNTEPTPAQAEAGNYKKGHVTIGEFDITIENPAGSVRKGVDANGNTWETTMSNAYGYIKDTESVDGDHIDAFLHTDMDEWNGRKVFVVDQTKEDGSFDEHKVMLGFNDKDEAMSAYLANYDATWAEKHPGLRISEVNIEYFNKWIQSSHRKTKPFADYSTVSKITDNAPTEPQKNDSFTIEARKDTRDNSDIYAVKFEERVSREEFKGQKAIAKKHGGYWSNFGKKGFLFKSEADAKAFAAEVMGKSEDDVADEAPLSMGDFGDKSDMSDRLIDWDEPGPEENPFLNVGADKPNEPPKTKKRSRWISDDDAAEFDDLRNNLRSHLGADDNIAQEDAPSYGKPQPKQMDAEVLRLGTRMTYLMMKGGLRKFSDYAEAMVEEVGDAIRPHLKSLYAAAQNMEEVIDLGWDEEMDDRKTVKTFDVYNFDKPEAKDIIETAQHVVDERESQKQTEDIIERLKDERNEKRKQAEDKKPLAPVGNEDYVDLANRAVKIHEKRKTQKNAKTSGHNQQTGDLFGELSDIPENDTLKTSNTKANEKTNVQSRTEETGRGGQQPRPDEPLGKGAEHEDERTDGRGVARRSGVHTVSDTERGGSVPVSHQSERGISQPKNTRNNHAERGVEYAPKGEKARIDANIAAIEVAKRLLESGAAATPEEMAVLRRYSGWGGLGSAFNEGKRWAPNPVNKRIREVLTPEEYEAAVMSRNSAYYTPASVIDAMWDIVKSLGFKGGNVLEGSAGIGNILGLMPTDLSARSDIHAIEIDPMTGGILSLLYPDAQIEVQGFEKTRIPNGSVDLAITNVPFVSGLHVLDESGDSDLSKRFRDIHDFCIAKNVRKLREGGIGIFITSSGTLDKSQKLRNWLVSDKDGNADVVGAFRLNNQTFGGTAATSDIIVVRKRVNGKRSAHAIDVSAVMPLRTMSYTDVKTGKTKDYPLLMNRYFIEHPEHMGGEMFFGYEQGDTYRPTSMGLFPVRSKEQTKQLASWVKGIAEKDLSTEAVGRPTEEATHMNEALGQGVKEGSMVLDNDGNLCVARMGRAIPIAVNKNKIKGRSKVECFKDYSVLKDALDAVLKYQTEHDDDTGLKPLLDKLNKAYDTFVQRYGNLNKNTNLAWLRNNDIDYPSIAALETVSEKATKDGNKEVSYGKTDIFSSRVVEKETEPAPKNVKDGIIASIYKFGRIDPDYLSAQLGKSQEEIKREIVESGLGFEEPTTGQMEVSYEYLSGNVREKLKQAHEAEAATPGKYAANIKALEAVVPMNIPAHLIEFTLGSSWIAPKLYEDYVKEKTDVEVTLTNAGGTWHMKEPYYTDLARNIEMGIRSEELGIFIPGHKLIEAAITNKTITVSKTKRNLNGTTETVTDQAATAACGAKVDEIRQEFKEWAREKMQNDPEMSMRMEAIYNEKFNNSVPKSIPDEFIPDHFGGAATMVGGKSFRLRPHQAKAVIRATTQPVMLAHEVGTGKTYTLITTAMEMRRLGTARKPMIVVQNATVGQFVASAKALYPNAKVLTLEDVDRNAEGRRAFYAKIKFNDWDMIVVPQSVFERIPDSAERQTKFIQDKIEEKLLVLEQMKGADPEGKSMIVRQAEKEISRLEDEIAQLATGGGSDKKKEKDAKKAAVTRQNAEVKARELLDRATDDVDDFDSMGIDAILVDEAHEYKHLGFATAMQRGVKGVDPTPSKKSQGVFLKVQSVLEKTGGKNVVFATGTPISNTAAEIWTFMRYLMPADVMKDYGIYYFDDFVRNFGNLQQMLEFTTSGKYKENNRFAGYVNLPELVRIWSTVADTVLTREAGGVSDKIPDMEGGKAQDVFLPQTRALRSIMKFVKAQLDDYDKMSGKEKKENSHIPLVMYGIAKAAAVDARLVQADAEDDPNSKTNETVRQTLRSLKETKSYKGVVSIFADNYQNKASGFNLYEDIRKKLVAAGVPKEQIVVMKPSMTVKKKLEIFNRANAGDVRVIMGSTFTLGTGVNMQERHHTLIHVDAPNRPMDYTQRNGRILRQGNMHRDWNQPVRVLRFGVEDSLDVTAYQRLKTKGAIADSIMNGRALMSNSMENRILEEEQDLYGDMTAQLSGSEWAMKKNQVEKEVRKLQSKQKQWAADQTYIHNRKRQIAGQNKEAEERIAANQGYLEKVEKAEMGAVTVGKLRFPTMESMEDFFKEQNKKKLELQEQVRNSGYSARSTKSELTLSIGGFDFKVETEIKYETKQGEGGLFASAPAKMTYSCAELGIDKAPVKENLLKNAVKEILEGVPSGRDFRERIDYARKTIERNNEELQSFAAREGQPFKEAEALAKAEAMLTEYEENMKRELEAKEAKYAEMDKGVDEAKGVEYSGEEEEEESASEPMAEYSLPDGKTTLSITDENGKFANRYETEDGREINYTSETGAESYGGLFDFDFSAENAGGKTVDSRARADGVRLEDNPGRTEPGSGLDRASGEFAVAERVFNETGSFSFTSGERIESAADVAFIFSALEDAAKEHTFAVYVKDGKPTVVELGMGSFNMSIADIPTASLAYNRIKPDEVYFVHNHPSGNLKCSPQDAQLLRRMQDMCDVPVYGVIINLKTGKFGTFDTGGSSGESVKRTPSHENALTIHTLDKQIFAPDYDPMSQPLVRSAKDVATFLNSHRMGDRAKVSFLILSQQGRIVGNIHTPFTEISTDVREKARYISDKVVQFGGASAIMYGDFDINSANGRDYIRLRDQLKQVGDTRLLDVVSVEGNHTRSANDEGVLYEPSSEYGASKDDDMRFREVERPNARDKRMLQTGEEAKRSHVKNMARKLNTSVRIVTDPAELTHKDAATQQAMRGSKGFYDSRTGEVTIVLPNHTDVEDIAGTVFHEVVAHKGLRELIGEENYDAFCDEVYDHLKDDLKQQIDQETTRRFMGEPGKGYEHHRRVAVDEMFGRMSEKGFEDFTKAERSIWAKLKVKVLEAINRFLGSLKLPKWVKLGDNELRYILWRSHQRLTGESDYVGMARDAAKREELGLTDNGLMHESREERELRQVNNRFNEQLQQQIDGQLPDDHVYHMGQPGAILRSTGIANLPIELRAKRLKDKATKFGHDYSLTEVRDLPIALQAPVAVFAYGDPAKAQNIVLQLRSGEKNFIVGLSITPTVGGRKLEINSVRNVFPKDNAEWVKWITDGKLLYIDKEKIQPIMSQLQTIPADVTRIGLDLNDAAKVIKTFENPTIETAESDLRFRDGETGDIWNDRSVGLEERITNAAIRLSNNQSGDMTLRNDAMRAIGGNLTSLRRAMAAQKRFDQATIKRVSDLARILMQNGYLSGMTGREMQRLILAVKNSVGHAEVKGSVQKIMDIMVDNQLRNAEGALRQLLSIRGSKVDARGIEVQGVLDVDGQRTMEVVKKAMSLKEDDINDRIAEALNRMSDPDQTIADNAVIEYAGLNMALDYVRDIAGSKADEKTLRDSLKTAKEDRDAGRMTDDTYKQYVETTEDTIRKNKIERAEAYFNLVGRLSDSLRGSIENAKAFREAEKARVNQIHHFANSDMEGRPNNEHHRDDWKDKVANNGFVQFLFAPLATFDQVMRVFGNKSANGEGYLWNRFMRGWVVARNKELQGVKEKFAQLDDKAAELFGKGKTWGSIIRMESKLPKATVSFWDGGEMCDHELTQGNLLYIYMVDKMTDGRMKLRRMGVTEQDIASIENFLDPRFKAIGDWLQDEFLVATRNEYNETHKRMFGASMATIENYFPLKILANARIDKEEDVNQQNTPDGITTKTGSIIKRRVNNLALDITGADALSVILDHITQMEHWNAYAEWNRDLNTLRTYKRFRNQVINMTTVYGGGRKLWENFNDLCLMAAGEYRPPIAKLDKSAVNIAKGVTAAKVSFRMFTALKQLLSAPAYAPEVSIRSIVKSIANPYGDFKWCMENMPIFRERWHSRISGDPRLLKNEKDWNMWRSRVMEICSRIGMTPNAFIDAVTVSIGARAMYETRLKQYLREGYPADAAEERAKQDAAILFNQTQQSSESPFLSTMQVDRSWLSVLFTVFRNSAMSYTRQEFDAMRNLKRNLTPGQRAKSVDFMTKQILRDWNAVEGDGNILEYCKQFNGQVEKYSQGILPVNERVELGYPCGAMSIFLPDLPIVMGQRVLHKGAEKKHNIDLQGLRDMPRFLSNPIFVFSRSENTIGVLTEMKDRNGKNVCVAIDLSREIQQGGDVLVVNDIRSIHGREIENVVLPIVHNGTLCWVDKEKGLKWLSSASQQVQQEIAIEDLKDAAKVVENFENPKTDSQQKKEERARAAAESRFKRQIRKDVIRVATFGYILGLAWDLGSYLLYIIFGNDENEKDKMWNDAMTHAYFGSVEGLTGGDVLSSFGNMAASGEWSFNQLTKDMPMASDINSIANKFIAGKDAEAINDIIFLVVQSGIGMNPQSITDAVVAIMDACGDDPALSHEAAIFVSRVLQVPQSQIDKMYFDEIGLSGEEASKLTPEQLAQRYAEYKVKRGTPLAPWSWDDEKRLGKYEKIAEGRMKERLEGQGDTEVKETYAGFEARYKAVSGKVKEAKALMKTDYMAAAQAHAELQQDPDFPLYQRFNMLDKQLSRISKMWLTSKSPEEAALIAATIPAYRAGMVKVLQAETAEAQQTAMSELTNLLNDFYTKYQAMHPQNMQVNR